MPEVIDSNYCPEPEGNDNPSWKSDQILAGLHYPTVLLLALFYFFFGKTKWICQLGPTRLQPNSNRWSWWRVGPRIATPMWDPILENNFEV
uniref:Uncharacterized protein n=1 Tax=Nelumbo nucifera TaxID=4432 RepID=A0A822XPZ4_NELNU|nr:TPA_asm: hypothetical protein HUJ06_021001 [Nelumbo nucifera]